MIGDESKVLPSGGIQIKYKGDFNLDSLYKDTKAWFDSRRYDFTEKEQTTKDKSLGREMVVRWEAEREVDDYAKFSIKIEFLIEEINKIKQGYNGSVKATVFAKVILDYKKNFKASRFKSILVKIYNNFIINKKIENVYEDKLDIEAKEVYDLIKERLGLMKE